jgi:hypothetical protein
MHACGHLPARLGSLQEALSVGKGTHNEGGGNKGRFVIRKAKEMVRSVVMVAREIVHVGGDFRREEVLEKCK